MLPATINRFADEALLRQSQRQGCEAVEDIRMKVADGHRGENGRYER